MKVFAFRNLLPTYDWGVAGTKVPYADVIPVGLLNHSFYRQAARRIDTLLIIQAENQQRHARG